MDHESWLLIVKFRLKLKKVGKTTRLFKMKVKVGQSCLTLCDPMDSPGQNTGVGSRSLLQQIFPTQGLNPGLLHCRRILYQLRYKEGALFTVSVPIFHYFTLQGHLSREGNRNPLRYSCLENPMDRGAWRAAVHGGHRVRHKFRDPTTARQTSLQLIILRCCHLLTI